MSTENFFNCEGGWETNPHNYVSRKADRELLDYCLNFQLRNPVFFLLAPRQMGKTTLMNQIISQLEEEEKIATISINVHLWDYINEEELFNTLLFRIVTAVPQLKNIESEIIESWNKYPGIIFSERFLHILSVKIYPKLKNVKLIIFIDEVQSLVRLKLQDKFIRFLKTFAEFNNEIRNKLNFVLIGVAKPSEFTLNADIRFNGKQIELEGLSGECLPLQKGLKAITTEPSQVIKRVLFWTGGQPFLTQYMCYLLLDDYFYISQDFEKAVDGFIRDKYIKNWRSKDKQSHLTGIENYFVKFEDSQIDRQLQLLNYYYRILINGPQKLESKNVLQEDLLMSGLVVKVIENNQYFLKVANPIYENIFNAEWTDEIRKILNLASVTNANRSAQTELNIAELDNFGAINKCFTILQQELKPFVKQRMDKYLGNNWRNHREVRMIVRPPDDKSPITIIDYQKLLTLIIKYWEDVFINVFNNRDKCEIEALLQFGDQEEKQRADFEDDFTVKVLNTIAYLLSTTGHKSKVKTIDELMMNKYPQKQKRNYYLISNRENTLGYEKYIEQENNIGETDIASRITNILNQRHPRTKKVRKLIKKLNFLLSELENMETVYSRLINTINDPSVTTKLRELFQIFVGINRKIQEVKQTLTKLDKRFSRENLTITFVGSAGQGKSRFIQTLTGLTKTEVPDGTIHNCTEVKVIIAHSTNHQTRGEVYLHTPESFIQENIAPYYPMLNLGKAPTTLDEFINHPLPKLKNPDARAKVYYEYLEKCKNHYSEYQALLQENSPKPIGKDEIRKYVAQTDENNDRTNFSYLAVKEVKIYCQFPHEDVRQITLIDLPGLGDTVLGYRETLRRSLGQDVDFALFVNMPKGRVLQEEDYELFDTANQALPELPIEKWSFFILNEVKNPPPGLGIADNRQVCEETKRRIDKERQIQVAKCMIADCADTNEASNVLLEVLNYLETHILELDDRSVSIVNKSIEQLEKEIKTFLEKARQAFRVAPKYQNENMLFYELADKLTRKISKNLHKLTQEIRPQTLIVEENKKDTKFFQTATKNIIKKCLEDTGVHSPEQIDYIRFDMESGTGWISVLERCIDELRTYISNKFNSFDSDFQMYVEQVKNQIADALTDTDLGNITTARGIDFLEFMTREIPEYLPTLKVAFEKLVSFKMTYEHHLEYLILQALEEELNPNPGDVFNPIFNPAGKSDEENIQIIHKILVVKHRNTISKCRQALEKLEGMPSIIIYGRANRFVDEVIRSEGIRNDWLVLLQEWSSQVFPDHFGKGISQEKQEWENSIQKAFSLSTLEKV
ncbi:MAG: ATP-binding protein [Okeania sp. SIO3B5]|uniref:AAA-like domain-containing protein n=1 Tax=Okeania sp. SIO3B5 TaxID=2607811 RepID=UPI0013FE8F66|nr:AAA-like domain-containing protein [Okeania sp. SIO3B5]NEO51791.1 ATP-binding protein [Okeania sp. SIO3B5]